MGLFGNINADSGKDAKLPFGINDIEDADARLRRFAPYIAKAFPETAKSAGIIGSDLAPIDRMKPELEKMTGRFGGRLFLKLDSNLPVSGSIKARGGIYEVLKFAEETAIKNGMLKETDDYSILTEDRFRELFSKYSVAVGSTGNLGLSIGIISAKLGFKVTVHMSADARQWKKDLLRAKGVTVIEYPEDYQVAVAAKRIAAQFETNNILVNEDHPVFVYIPCGVGGAPGGVTFGLKELFGDNLHVFFAEPTHAPCMTLARLADTENIFIEPSSCASFTGPALVAAEEDYLASKGLAGKMENAVHILWATGGSMVPEEEMKSYYERGK